MLGSGFVVHLAHNGRSHVLGPIFQSHSAVACSSHSHSFGTPSFGNFPQTMATLPETKDADCELNPERRVCIDACILQVDQADCAPIVDVCRDEPGRDRCDVLLQLCDDMPAALGCGGAGLDDAGADT